MGAKLKYRIFNLFKVKRKVKLAHTSAVVEKASPEARNNHFGFIIIAVIILLIAYYVLPIIYNLISLDFTKGRGDNVIVSENLNTPRTNIILIGAHEYGSYTFIDAIILLSYDFTTKELGVFSVNPDIKANIPTINKQTELRRLYNSLYVKDHETDYFISTVESLLAIKIDRYMYVSIDNFYKLSKDLPDLAMNVNTDVVDPNTVNLPSGKAANITKGAKKINPDELLELIASNSNSRNDQLDRQVNSIVAMFKGLRSPKVAININSLIASLLTGVKTNMSKLEIFRLGYELLSLRDDTVKKGYTRSSSYIKLPSTFIYGSYMINQERLDKDISTIFFNLDVFKEHAKIEIFNGTNVRGLAGNRSRWIRNIGGNVVKTGNTESYVDEVSIYCEDTTMFEKTISEIKKIFPVHINIEYGKYYNRQVGDIVLVIGKNY